MKIGIVPTLYGYSAVVLPPYSGAWELSTPVALTRDLKVQLRGQILAALATFAHAMTPWTKMLPVALFWAAWGGTALYLRLARYWDIDMKFVLLYGWIMFLFFGDGVFALGRYLYQLPNLLRAGSIREDVASGEWSVTTCNMPMRTSIASGLTEEEYIAQAAALFPQTRPFYDEMLTKEQPLAFRYWPLGLRELVVYLFIGPRIPPPHVVIELGKVLQ